MIMEDLRKMEEIVNLVVHVDQTLWINMKGESVITLESQEILWESFRRRKLIKLNKENKTINKVS